MTTATSPTPSNSSGMSKVNRARPTPESTPTVAIASPVAALSKALAGLLPAKLVMRAKPSRETRNSSGAPNSSASRLNGATTTKPMTPMSPPMNEARAAMTRAGPPRPFLAI